MKEGTVVVSTDSAVEGCMKQQISNKHIGILVGLVVIFSVGFISSLLIITRRSDILTTSLLENPIAGTHAVSFLGMNVMNFVVTVSQDKVTDISIIQSSYYYFVPIIAWGGLVAISLVLSVLAKALLARVKSKRDYISEL